MDRVLRAAWSAMVALALVLVPAGPPVAAASAVHIVIDGQKVEIPARDQAAFISAGRTYVPLRVVSEHLGALVEWLPATRQVRITTRGQAVAEAPSRAASAGTVEVVIDGRPLSIPPAYGAAFITRAGRVVVPLRAVGEALGCEVSWDAATCTVRIASRPEGPARGEVERPTQGAADPADAPAPAPEPVAPAPASQESASSSDLLQQLAAYRTNLRLLDGQVVNSSVLAGQSLSAFSEAQVQQFRSALQQLSAYPLVLELGSGDRIVVADFSIMGEAMASAAQLRAWMERETPRLQAKMRSMGREMLPIPDLAELYLRIGAEYGVRGDVAFAQAVKETGYFQFTGSVQPFQNNYCGLWAVGSPCSGSEPLNGADGTRVRFQSGVHGAIFASPEAGVEAHIQHLYAYATRAPLPAGKTLVDPRFTLVSRGSAPTWQALNARWAVPGTTYGQSILKDYWAQALVAD